MILCKYLVNTSFIFRSEQLLGLLFGQFALPGKIINVFLKIVIFFVSFVSKKNTCRLIKTTSLKGFFVVAVAIRTY